MYIYRSRVKIQNDGLQQRLNQYSHLCFHENQNLKRKYLNMCRCFQLFERKKRKRNLVCVFVCFVCGSASITNDILSKVLFRGINSFENNNMRKNLNCIYMCVYIYTYNNIRVSLSLSFPGPPFCKHKREREAIQHMN